MSCTPSPSHAARHRRAGASSRGTCTERSRSRRSHPYRYRSWSSGIRLRAPPPRRRGRSLAAGEGSPSCAVPSATQNGPVASTIGWSARRLVPSQPFGKSQSLAVTIASASSRRRKTSITSPARDGSRVRQFDGVEPLPGFSQLTAQPEATVAGGTLTSEPTDAGALEVVEVAFDARRRTEREGDPTSAEGLPLSVEIGGEELGLDRPVSRLAACTFNLGHVRRYLSRYPAPRPSPPKQTKTPRVRGFPRWAVLGSNQ